MNIYSGKHVLDNIVIDSIQTACEEQGQSEKVSKRLVAWFEDLVQGRAGQTGNEEDKRHFDALRRALDISKLEDSE